jgi:hypothetical protein
VQTYEKEPVYVAKAWAVSCRVGLCVGQDQSPVSSGHREEVQSPISPTANVAYCDTDCSKRHWPTHKYHCRLARPLDETDNLVLACRKNEFPKDDEVVANFGFAHVAMATDRLRLFAIYCTIVERAGVDDDELRAALQTDKLREFLLFSGSQISGTLVTISSGCAGSQALLPTLSTTV